MSTNISMRETKESREKRRALAREQRHKQMNKYLGYRVGQAIQKYQKKSGLKSQELADKLGCNIGTLAKWKKMNNDMRLDSFLTVVRELDLSVSDLIENTEWEDINL